MRSLLPRKFRLYPDKKLLETLWGRHDREVHGKPVKVAMLNPNMPIPQTPKPSNPKQSKPNRPWSLKNEPALNPTLGFEDALADHTKLQPGCQVVR